MRSSACAATTSFSSSCPAAANLAALAECGVDALITDTAVRQRIDGEGGKAQCARRFATVEPVFAYLRHNKRLNRFTLRGQRKVDGQWQLFALAHNIEKWTKLRKAA